MAKRRPPGDDDSDDPVKFPFGESLDDSDVGDTDPVKFPFGETGERPGARPFGQSLSELGALDDSDIEAFDSSLDLDDEDVFGSSEQLPSVPPGSRPQDDASFEGLEDALIQASSAEARRLDSDAHPLTPSELGEVPFSDLGPIDPSGPLVIVDDGVGDASTRYQASVVDDSIRMAGRKSVRRPPSGRADKPPAKGKAKPKQPAATTPPPAANLEQSSEWSEEPLDDAIPVPTPSRRSRSRSGRRPAAAPPPASAGKLVWLVGALGVVAAVIVGVVQEQRRLADLRALEERKQTELEAAHSERRTAVETLTQEHTAALEAERTQREAREAELQRQRERVDALGGELEQAKGLAERAEGELAAERRRTAQATESLEAELQAVRAELDAASGDEALRAELEAKHRAALEAKDAELQASQTERARLERELAAARAQVARLEDELEQARRDAEATRVDDHGGGDDGGGDGGGGDDWDDFFKDSSDAPDDQAFFDEPDEDDGPNPVAAAWSWFQSNTPVHGSLAYKNLTHFSTGPPGHDLQKVRNEFRALVSYKGWLYQTSDMNAGVRLVAGLDIKFDDGNYTQHAFMRSTDDEEDKRPVVVPDEIYLALNYDAFTFRGGYQKFAWGTGDLFNPTDNINPIDYSDLFDPREIPVLAYTLALDFEDVSLELVAVPTFTRSRLPLQGQRFDILAEAQAPILAPDDPENDIQNAQFAGKLTLRKFGWDVSLSGYTGFDDVPAGQVAISSVFPIVGQVQTEFNKIHVLGLDFATTLGFLGLEGKLGDVLSGIQLHGEMAHFWYEGERVDDYAQYVFGFNYQFIDVIGEQDLTLIVEYAGEIETHTAEQPLPGTTLSRLFQSAWLARIVYDPHEDVSIALNMAWLVHGPDSLYLHPEATWTVTDYLEVIVGGDIFTGKNGTFFGQFDRDDRFVGQVRILF